MESNSVKLKLDITKKTRGISDTPKTKCSFMSGLHCMIDEVLPEFKKKRIEITKENFNVNIRGLVKV